MSVDVSVSIGVGFVIDPDAFERYRALVLNQENYADEELLEDALKGNTDGLVFGTGGSCYTSAETIIHWIAIDRLTENYDFYQMPGGVVGLTKVIITLKEREALNRMAEFFGHSSIEIGQFISVLWY